MMISVTGDTHGSFGRIKKYCIDNNTTKDDILIIETGSASPSEKSTLKISRWAVAEVTKPGKETDEKSEEN